ncbi:hypothetical protein RYX36_009127, partial [Vicia faba]
MPPTHFSQVQIPYGSSPHAFAHNWHIAHQMPAYYAHNPHIPHQAPAHYVDNRYLSQHPMPTHYADNRPLPHPTPTHYADNRHIPHQASAHYVDNRNLPHQIPTHHVDNMHLSHQAPTDNRPLPHPTPTHYADNRPWQHQMATHYADNSTLPHPTPAHYADNRHLLLPTPAHYADKSHLPHQTAEHSTDIKHLPPQTVEQCTDNKHLPDQTPVKYEDKMCLPHQKTKDLADKMHLPNHNQEDCAANKCLPHKTPDHNADKRQLPQQTSEAYADKRQLLHQTLEHSADKNLPQQTLKDSAADKNLSQQTLKDSAADKNLSQQTLKDSAADKNLSQQTLKDSAADKNLSQQTLKDSAADKNLSQQTLKDSADKNLSQQTFKDTADKKCLPQQTPEDCAYKKCLPPLLQCEICELILNPKSMEIHIKGMRHRRRVLQLHEQSTKYKTSSGEEIRHDRSSQISKEAYAANKCLPHKTPDHNADKRQLSQQTSEACADKRQVPDQPSEQYTDKNLSQQTPKDSAEKKCLPQQTPEDCANKKCLPPLLQKCEICDRKLDPKCMESHKKGKKHLRRLFKLHEQSTEHKTSRGEEIIHNRISQISKEAHAYAAKKRLSHQTPDHYADKRQLSQQTLEACADKRQLPNQTSEQYADKNLSHKNLSQQTPEDCADKKCLPQQTPEDCANKKCLTPLLQCEICDLKLNPKSMESHNKGKRHRRRLIELREQSTKHKTSSGEEIGPNRSSQISKEAYADNKCLPHQMSEHYADKKNSSQQAPKDYANKKCLPSIIRCEICDVKFTPKCLKDHNNGIKHERRLLELREKSMKHKDSNGEEISHIRSSQINPVVQPKKVPADVSKRKLGDLTGAKDHDFKVENVKNETSSFKKKNVPAEISKRKVRDNTDAKNHGFKHEIEGATGGKYMKMNNGIRRSVKNDQPQSTPVELKASAGANIIAEKEYISCDFAATVIPQGPVASHAFTPPPAVESSVEPKNHIDLPREVTEAQQHYKVQKCGVETNDEPQSISMELQALGGCNIITVAEDNSSDSDEIVIALPQGLVTSQVLSPSPAAGSSFEPPIQINSQIEVEEGTELHEVQNLSVETNDQPHAISMEFHATAGSDINTLTEGTCSDSGAIIIAPPQSPIAYEVSTPVAVIQTGMSDSKVHNEIQNLIVDSNNQQCSISMELHDVAGSITNNQIEVLNSDSTAVEIYKEPHASLLPDAVGSIFEPVTEHGLDTETEPHVSEAILDIESQHPAEETDIELLPPVLMEIDVALEVSAETKTEKERSQAEMKMDVDLSLESGKTKLLKVSVCLTCGDEGFEEAIVYCSKCGDYAMHRYCLAGPVVFTDKVTWFCEDCEEIVVEADHPYSETPESEKDEVVFDPQPIADPVWSGSLQVLNKSFDKISGLMGHLSTLACPKVLEEARHLPDVLNANLLQRSAVWPESFKKFGTNNQSIGLYLFPENERVERYYDQLVDEMIYKDLAISVMVEKTELLIFPSTLLPRQYK